jgi:probable HAF family extracellular repeat protein
MRLIFFRCIGPSIVAIVFASGVHAASLIPLGDLAGGIFNSTANGVSADGSVVVGSSFSASGKQSYRWTSAGGMVGLDDLPGSHSLNFAEGVSADGSVVVGRRFDGAFVWTQANGMQRLMDVLLAQSATGLTDWTLLDAWDISADGQWIVGTGINPSGFNEAFLANIAVPIPPAAWLFGSALGILGWMRRRRTESNTDNKGA